VYFYDGSLRARPQLPPQWQSPLGALQRPGVSVHREATGPASNVPAIFQERFPQRRYERLQRTDFSPPPPTARPRRRQRLQPPR